MSDNPKHSSKSAEHFTPIVIVEAARRTLGRIDLDPASTQEANKIIRAGRIYTKAENGMKAGWSGRVFLNPPGGLLKAGTKPTRSRQAMWWAKLAVEWTRGRVEAAIFVGFSIEIFQTSQAVGLCVPTPMDFPFCVPSSRVQFDQIADGERRAGKNPSHSNVIVYLPSRMDREAKRFKEAFESIGKVRI